MHPKVLGNKGALAHNLHTNVVALKINHLHLKDVSEATHLSLGNTRLSPNICMLARSCQAPACSDRPCLEGNCTCWPPCRNQGTAHSWGQPNPQDSPPLRHQPPPEVGGLFLQQQDRQAACHGGQSPGASIKLSQEKAPPASLLASAPPPRVKGQGRGLCHSNPAPPALLSPCRAGAHLVCCLSLGALPGSCLLKWKLPALPEAPRCHDLCCLIAGLWVCAATCLFSSTVILAARNSRAEELPGLCPPTALLGSQSNTPFSPRETPAPAHRPFCITLVLHRLQPLP